MESGDAGRYILAYSLERHQREFASAGVRYKSIGQDDALIGFVLLVLDADGESVEFRRIVVARPGSGIGTVIVNRVGELARTELGRSRVWLDVFEDNERARHVYEKCGYRPFGRAQHEGRTLLQYERRV